MTAWAYCAMVLLASCLEAPDCPGWEFCLHHLPDGHSQQVAQTVCAVYQREVLDLSTSSSCVRIHRINIMKLNIGLAHSTHDTNLLEINPAACPSECWHTESLQEWKLRDGPAPSYRVAETPENIANPRLWSADNPDPGIRKFCTHRAFAYWGSDSRLTPWVCTSPHPRHPHRGALSFLPDRG